jgi:CRP/FNR family transcriptional regulator, nitrogen fixation regulation protein
MLRLCGQYGTAQLHVSETVLKFRKGEIIYAQGDPATDWFEVVSGTVRTCHLYPDGHRQLSGFFYSGDVFGIDAHSYQSSAEAVTAVALRRCQRSTNQPNKVDEVSAPLGMLQSALNNAQACIFLLGRRTATERVAAFLLATSRRLGGRASIRLPMSRSDIADHLGLTIHTVSRTLSELSRRGLIALDGPQAITLCAPGALQQLAEGGEDYARASTSASVPAGLAIGNGAPTFAYGGQS